MNETDQLSLSRYVDGDLSPLERKKVEAMLDADPTARRMVAEYSRMSQFVGELPRESLNQDLVPLLRESLARKRNFPTIPAQSPVLAGLMAASVLFVTFTVSYVCQPQRAPMAGKPTPDIRSPLASSPPSASPSEIDLPKTATDPVFPFPARAQPASESATVVAPNVSMALSQSATRLGGQLAVRKFPPEFEERFRGFSKATESTDRKHSFRLHVSSASDRQIDSVLSLIGRFRAAEASVLERKTIGEDKKVVLGYVVLIPTGRMADFRAAIRSLPGIEVEQDRPENFMKRDDGTSNVIRFVENDELARAIDSVGLRTPVPASDPATQPLKRSRPDDEVPDAISQPLKVESANETATGTLDEVAIWIRTDPLSVGKEAAPTRPE